MVSKKKMKRNNNKSTMGVRICSCGRIHFYDEKHVDDAIAADKEVLFICGGCGRATRIGADDWTGYYDDNEPCYAMYQQDVEKEAVWTADIFNPAENKKAISEILYSPGKKVMMQTGYYAKAYSNGYFEDIWYPDFCKLEHEGLTVQEVMEFINEYRTNRRKVNMRALMKALTPEEAKVLYSRCLIKSFDWSETELGPQRTKHRKVNLRALMKEPTPEKAKVLHSRCLIESFDCSETELDPQNF